MTGLLRLISGISLMMGEMQIETMRCHLTSVRGALAKRRKIVCADKYVQKTKLLDATGRWVPMR